MFFIGIFGVEDREKPVRDFVNAVCPVCGRLTSAHIYEHYTYFHVFFIPTIRWNKHYFVKLRCCGALYEADAAYAQELKTAVGIDFSRLKKISGGFGGFGDMFAHCPRCGADFDASFAYCPHCGAKK